MRSAFFKNNFREVRHTLGRFLAILAIIALGVGFFAGLVVTKPSMIRTLNGYARETAMFDFRLLSTLGFDTEAPARIAEAPGVGRAVGGYATDAAFTDDSGVERLLKVMSISRDVNRPVLTAGRMPETDSECLLDARYFGEKFLGSTLRLNAENSDGAAERLRYGNYTVVGLAKSVLYINAERDTTRLGNGKLDGFLLLPPGGFDCDYYTEIYVTLAETADAYSEAYDALVDAAEPAVTAACEAQADARYQRIYTDAQAELDDARQELADARRELEDGRRDYADGLADYQTERADAEAELADALAELEDAAVQLEDGRAALQDTEQELWNKRAEVTDGLAQLEDGLAQISDGIAQVQDGIDQLSAALAQLEAQMAAPGAALYRPALEAQKAELEGQLAGLEAQKAQLHAQKDALLGQKADAQAGLAAIDAGLAELASKRQELNEKEADLAQGRADYASAKQEAEEKFADAEAELADAQAKLTDGEAELAEAEEKLADAEAELADLEAPDCYVLGRDTNVGYVCFDNDASIVAGVAKVFPLFFFLVAALVCVTTMTRMVDDQRTQIGVLKALGYTNAAITRKYVSYAGIAALLGCVLGFFLGTVLFPRAIWMAYAILYGFADIVYVFQPWLLLISVAVALLCSVGTTFLACRSELQNMPAALMRPKAPKAGKRILLERIPFLWERMKFLHKVSARNILRYKKRLFMMVLGIAGCTALVVTGFGINDSIHDIVSDQFDEIMVYDYSVSFSGALDADGAARFRADSGAWLDNCVFVNAGTIDIDTGHGTKSANLIATDDPAGLTALIDLHLGSEPVAYPGDGQVVINEKIAAYANVAVGDTLLLRPDEVSTCAVTVSGICENYVYNYIYMTADTYRSVYGEDMDYNQALATAADGQDGHVTAAYLINNCDAAAVSVVKDLKERVDDMMDSLNFVVWLVIACAAALAFVVLCNLSNINISERVREIATIKVLGFYPGEVGAYVFRENFVLTAVGALVGLPLGMLLHRFVMAQINIDMVTFQVRIAPSSYLLAVGLTFAFTLIVDLLMRRKLGAISMADSLKSVE